MPSASSSPKGSPRITPSSTPLVRPQGDASSSDVDGADAVPHLDLTNTVRDPVDGATSTLARSNASLHLPPELIRLIAEYVPAQRLMYVLELIQTYEDRPELHAKLGELIAARDVWSNPPPVPGPHPFGPSTRAEIKNQADLEDWSGRLAMWSSPKGTIRTLGLSRLMLPLAKMAVKAKQQAVQIDQLERMVMAMETRAVQKDEPMHRLLLQLFCFELARDVASGPAATYISLPQEHIPEFEDVQAVLEQVLKEGKIDHQSIAALTTTVLSLWGHATLDAVPAFRHELEAQIGRLPQGEADRLRCKLVTLPPTPLTRAIRDALAARALQDEKARSEMAGSSSSSSSSSSSGAS